MRHSERGGEGVGVRRDGELGNQQEDAAEESAEPPNSLPVQRGAQPGGGAPVLGMLPKNGHGRGEGT